MALQAACSGIANTRLQTNYTNAARRVNAAKAVAGEMVRRGRSKKTKELAPAAVAVKRNALPMTVPDDDWSKEEIPTARAKRIEDIPESSVYYVSHTFPYACYHTGNHSCQFQRATPP